MSSTGWKDVGIDLNVTLSKLKNMLLIESPNVSMKEINGKVRSRSSRAVGRTKSPRDPVIIRWA